MRRIKALVALLLALTALSGCYVPLYRDYSAGPVEGQVIDLTTGQAIADALVVAQWAGHARSHSAAKRCINMTVTRSDAQGRWRVEGWERHFYNLDGFVPVFEAYKPGYELIVPPMPEYYQIDRMQRTVSSTRINMRPFVGDQVARLDRISVVYQRNSCSTEPDDFKEARFDLLTAVVREIEQMPDSDEDTGQFTTIGRPSLKVWRHSFRCDVVEMARDLKREAPTWARTEKCQ